MKIIYGKERHEIIQMFGKDLHEVAVILCAAVK